MLDVDFQIPIGTTVGSDNVQSNSYGIKMIARIWEPMAFMFGRSFNNNFIYAESQYADSQIF